MLVMKTVKYLDEKKCFEIFFSYIQRLSVFCTYVYFCIMSSLSNAFVMVHSTKCLYRYMHRQKHITLYIGWSFLSSIMTLIILKNINIKKKNLLKINIKNVSKSTYVFLIIIFEVFNFLSDNRLTFLIFFFFYVNYFLEYFDL